MLSSNAIALYLGESYASLGLFNLSQSKTPEKIFEKSVFLPQVSFKNLLLQTKLARPDFFSESENIKIFIVTKYLDRLKNFRLGGSVAQVVLQGFENSYAALNSKSLSLAASSLVVSLDEKTLTTEFLAQELARIKKINPDANKVVIQLPEKSFAPEKRLMVFHFFESAGFKIFSCSDPFDLAEIRKTLLNAGTEGTKEELLTDLKEVFGEQIEILFWTRYGFRKDFENSDLFASSGHFIAELARDRGADYAFYLDHENFRLITTSEQNNWQSPWGSIPAVHHDFQDVAPHPFAEIRLNHLSFMGVSSASAQYEPGPVLAGRGLKPLVLDLFYEELSQIESMKSLFPALSNENQKQKLRNHLSVLEKGQIQSALSTSREELKKNILDQLKNHYETLSRQHKVFLTGPLGVFIQPDSENFNWVDLILKKAQN